MTSASQTDGSDEKLNNFIRSLSNDRVVGVDTVGPLFSRDAGIRRKPDPATFVPALSASAAMTVKALTACWIATYAAFWVWWCLPAHRTGWGSFVVNSALLANTSAFPAYFLITVNRLRRVSPAIEIPTLRVAMAVTKAPSEPWPVVRNTLQGMLDQDFPYPYDVWLCDEDPSAETLAWCAENGVKVSTRKGVEPYQRVTWPRRRRCKEGNLTYFYDHYGYRNYDVVSQRDADHVPSPTYLAEMVRPFADPAIGYVAAPSMNSKNQRVSWSVRGRLFHEAIFHGPHQLGHNRDLAPISIGSHYTVRTQALASIGGLGPELAEDFSTSYLMYVGGWCGAFAIDAAAHGDGPPDFPAMATQEFQWSRSLFLIMLNLFPRTIQRVPAKMRFRFGFVLCYHPLLVVSTLGGLSLVAAAAVFGIQWVRVNYFVFLGFTSTLATWMILLRLVSQRQGLLRPNDTPLVSWEATLFLLARWPLVALGLLAALTQKFAPRPVELRVTRKGAGTVTPLTLGLMLPYIAIVVVMSVSAMVGMRQHGTVGYIGLCILAAATYGVVSVAVPILHGLQASKASPQSPARTFFRSVRGTLPFCILALGPLAVDLFLYPAYFEHIFVR